MATRKKASKPAEKPTKRPPGRPPKERAEGDEGLTMVSFRIPRATLQELKNHVAYAMLRGEELTLQSMVTEALDEWLARNPARQ